LEKNISKGQKFSLRKYTRCIKSYTYKHNTVGIIDVVSAGMKNLSLAMDLYSQKRYWLKRCQMKLPVFIARPFL
jgi:hypothetical protein